MLPLFEVISYDSTQFGILIQILLFIVFMWIGYEIPALEGHVSTFHFMPFSGGLFILFAGLIFISLSFTVDTYLELFVGSLLKSIGIIILIYGVLKAFYYSGNQDDAN